MELELNDKKKRFQVKRASARQLGWKWEIDFEDVEWPQVCPVLHIPIEYDLEAQRTDNSPSWTLLDKTKGWVKGNVKIVSWRASRLRGDGTWKEHKAISDYFMGC